MEFILKVFKQQDGDECGPNWMCTALALVPTKVLMRRFCLSVLKKSSICHLLADGLPRWWKTKVSFFITRNHRSSPARHHF